MEGLLDNDTDIAVETRLTEEVNILWTEHVRVSGTKKASAMELRIVRAQLAEKLFNMKQVLSRPGRSGQWRGWLEEVKIPRSTADRLVERHAEISGDAIGNVPSGAIAPEQQVEGLVKSMLPRLRRVLTSPQMAYQYVVGVIKEFDLYCETTEGGILLARPSSEQKTAAEAEPCLDSDGAAENVNEVSIESRDWGGVRT
ncbi:MAG: hypothetical protein ABSC64_03320 [Candidatus Korobacteraceae bacterium]